MDIIPFESGKLPAFLKAEAADVNTDITAHASAGYPVISIKGKVFATVRDGERSIIPNPKDPEAAATSLEVVLLKVNKNTSKIYYSKGYTEGSDAKPDCWSNDGIAPDLSVENPQSSKCATCKHSQWGSKISESGKKGKACSDAVRMAIAAPDQLNDPFLIRVPAASIRGLGEYGSMLSKRGVPYQAVVTKLSFDMEEATPKLVYKALGFLSEERYAEAKEVAESDLVRNIIGASIVPVEVEAVAEKAVAKAAAAPSKEKTVTAEEVVAAVESAEAVVKQEKKAPAKQESEVDVDLNLDDLSFDD